MKSRDLESHNNKSYFCVCLRDLTLFYQTVPSFTKPQLHPQVDKDV